MSVQRLSALTVDQLKDTAKLDVLGSADSDRIVHFGLGQFSRAHLAFYTERANQDSSKPWRITAVNLNSPGTKRVLNEQDFCYTVTARDAKVTTTHLVRVVDQALCPADGDGDLLKQALTSPHTKIVSLTITEKGYCRNSNGRLDVDRSDVKQDLANPDHPASALGWLVWGIRNRKALGVAPFAVLSMDNLNGNGKVLKQLVLELASAQDPGLPESIQSEVVFPCSMVDRIVPAVAEEQILEVQTLLGVRDEACVLTEKFSQWVLEDHPFMIRPPWQTAGVELCADVEPFERMKLRLLNGAHSALAYVGCLLELETVAECMADASVKRFVERLMVEEVRPHVKAPPNTDLMIYIQNLLERFANPHLHHKVAQIAMDGSEKIPQRWLPVLESRMAVEGNSDFLVFCLACWIEYVRTCASLKDPIGDELKRLVSELGPKGLICESGLFSEPLQNSEVLGAIEEACQLIQDQGARPALESLVAR